MSYECARRRLNGSDQGQCRTKVKVLDENLVGEVHDHTHTTNPEAGEVLIARQEIKKRAKETSDLTSQTVSTVIGSLTEAS